MIVMKGKLIRPNCHIKCPESVIVHHVFIYKCKIHPLATQSLQVMSKMRLHASSKSQSTEMPKGDTTSVSW
jgi:hypothetical protein